MNAELIDHYYAHGYAVVPAVLSAEEILTIRSEYHAFLASQGVDVNDLHNTGHRLSALSSTGGAGGVLDIFWAQFKLSLLDHPRILDAFSALWEATFASSCRQGYEHTHGAFDPNKPLAAVDRVCFRLPDALSLHCGDGRKPLQRHLAPHLDCCPHPLPSSSSSSAVSPSAPSLGKWRPVQAFVALTDDLGADGGGFECCPGMHLQFNEWAAQRPWSKRAIGKRCKGQNESLITQVTEVENWELVPPPCVGPFTPMRPEEDAAVLRRMVPVPCRAGDLVMWDNRLPHASALHHYGDAPREVAYICVLPRVPQVRACVLLRDCPKNADGLSPRLTLLNSRVFLLCLHPRCHRTCRTYWRSAIAMPPDSRRPTSGSALGVRQRPM